MKKAVLLLLLSAGLLWLPALTFATEKEQPEDEQSQDPMERVLVRIGDVEITQYEFDLEFNTGMERMKAENRAMFMNPHGRKQFLNMLADDKVWVNGAIEAGYDKDPMVVTRVKMYRDKALIRTFYEKEIVARAMPSEGEARKFYDANPERFLVPVRMNAKHILLADSVEATQVLAKLKAGADFEKMAMEKSIDETTADKGGDLGLLVRGVALPAAIGGSPEFEQTLFSLEQGVLSDVLKTHNGYHIVLVYEKMPAKVRPFESVKRHIENGFLKDRVAQLRKEMFADLNKRFPIEYFMPDSSESPEMSSVPPDVASTPEELFQAAMDSRDSRQRIAIYEELIRKFPESKHASQAQFMVGFIYSEELTDYGKAEAAFRTVIEEYPESELVDSARWMIGNMRDESQEVGTMEDVRRKAKESSESGGQ